MLDAAHRFEAFVVPWIVEQGGCVGWQMQIRAQLDGIPCTVLSWPASVTAIKDGDTWVYLPERPAVLDEEFRRKLAVKAFGMTRDYDTTIHAYLLREFEPPVTETATGALAPGGSGVASGPLIAAPPASPAFDGIYYNENCTSGPTSGTSRRCSRTRRE